MLANQEPNSSAQVDALARMASQAASLGRLEEAAQAWARVLALAPAHDRALGFLGQHARRSGDLQAARDFLERAERAQPRDPNIPLNISFVYRAMGNSEMEWAAILRALASDPYFGPALLCKGMYLERAGKRRAAAEVFANVLKILPPADQIPTALKSQIAHAQEVVRENTEKMEEFLRARLAHLRETHAGEKLQRFDECKDFATGRRKVYTQSPCMLHFPQLAPIQFYDDSEFPWLPKLEAATPEIREELFVLLREDSKGFEPYVNHPDDSPQTQWRELNRSPRWNAFHLWRNGIRQDEACQRCPRTAKLMEELPALDLPGFGPNIMFSCLAPHTAIPPHTGETNVRLITHLALIVPGQCYFRVGNETREWQEDKAWIFDDTFEHEARNESDKLRVILMMDVWNPYVTKAERELVSALLAGVREYYLSD
ncbi:MAG: aspartyl/asparaginyl beta-hydroxylase domain-containing protein [Alphaproteobacteria bacterium]